MQIVSSSPRGERVGSLRSLSICASVLKVVATSLIELLNCVVAMLLFVC
jgi:hypothetical protein